MSPKLLRPVCNRQRQPHQNSKPERCLPPKTEHNRRI